MSISKLIAAQDYKPPKRKNLIISFSGGETSAYMTWLLLNYKHHYKDVYVVFANTGEEHEATLEFVRQCDEVFGFKTVWLEAHIKEMGVGTSFRVVDFNSAARAGEPFEAFIRKHGIPNEAFKGCTRDLKRYPIEAYARSLGWKKSDYSIAIGIRVDEFDRMSSDLSRGIIYPLITTYPSTKQHVNAFWARQTFRLKLKSYQGNCKWCWKKSLRKHFTLIAETPQVFDFPRRMEALYGEIGSEFKKENRVGYRRKFFRGALSTNELFALYEKRGSEVPLAVDESKDLPGPFDMTLDVHGGCAESCEVFADGE